MTLSTYQIQMKIAKLISCKLLGEYEIKQWNSDQWNLKRDTNKLWQGLHFGLLLVSGILHAVGAIAIIPPIYNLLLSRIHIMQVSAWIFTGSAFMFACAALMECWIELTQNKSLLMKILALLCLYSSYVLVYSSIMFTQSISNTLGGLYRWMEGGRLLGYGRVAKLLVMTKFNVINSLIFSKSLQVHFQAILALVGVSELYTAQAFLAYADNYEYFYYGVASNLFISSIRIGAAILIYRQYNPQRQQIDADQLNSSQDSI